MADSVWMLENAIYSVISPEGCASILWKDASRAEQAAEYLKLTAEDSLNGGLIDRMISEEDIGTEEFYGRLKEDIACCIENIKALPEEEMLEKRYQRFRQVGLPEA